MSSNLSKSEETEEYRAAAHDWQHLCAKKDYEIKELKRIVNCLNKSKLSYDYLVRLSLLYPEKIVT